MIIRACVSAAVVAAIVSAVVAAVFIIAAVSVVAAVVIVVATGVISGIASVISQAARRVSVSVAIISDGGGSTFSAEAVIRVLFAFESVVHGDRVGHHICIEVEHFDIVFAGETIFLSPLHTFSFEFVPAFRVGGKLGCYGRAMDPQVVLGQDFGAVTEIVVNYI